MINLNFRYPNIDLWTFEFGYHKIDRVVLQNGKDFVLSHNHFIEVNK